MGRPSQVAPYVFGPLDWQRPTLPFRGAGPPTTTTVARTTLRQKVVKTHEYVAHPTGVLRLSFLQVCDIIRAKFDVKDWLLKG